MTITRIGSATGTNSLTMPAHEAGDLLLMFAYRDGSTTAPSLPAGWTGVISGGTATNSCRIGYKIAASDAETSGTWTSATSLICVVYRSDGIIGIGGSARVSAASTTVSYPALTMTNTDGTSWVAGFAGHRSVNTSIETPPTGMTNITSVLDATDEAAAHDTNGPVSSWSLTTVSVGGTSSGWNGATVEITDEPLPVPPSGDNPATIMASAAEVDLFFDAAASDLFQDTAGTTAATTDGDPVNFIASLWGPDFVAGASSGRNAVLRLPGGDDPYLEAVAGSSQLRANLTRSGDLYVIVRGRWNGTGDDRESFWWLHENASQFYTGDFMTPTYFPFGFNTIQVESSAGYLVTSSAVTITRGAWSTLEVWVSGSTIYAAVDGGTPETYAGSALGDTTLMDIFGSLDGGVTGSYAVDIRRLAVLNVIPDSTERTNLLDWAENGDAGGPTAIDATFSGTTSFSLAAEAFVSISAEADLTLSFDFSASAEAKVSAAFSGEISFSASAETGAVVDGAATGSIGFSLAAEAVAKVSAEFSGAVDFSLSGSAKTAADASATSTVDFSLSAEAVVLVDAELAAELPFSLDGEIVLGNAPIDAEFTGTLQFGLSAAAEVAVAAEAALSLPFTVEAAASALVDAALSAELPFTLAGELTLPDAPIDAELAGSVSFGLAASASVRVRASSSTELTFTATSSGEISVSGEAFGVLPLSVEAIAAVQVTAAFTGQLDFALAATAIEPPDIFPMESLPGVWRAPIVLAGIWPAETGRISTPHLLSGLWRANILPGIWRAA